jgi:predicted metal-dependent peptidase
MKLTIEQRLQKAHFAVIHNIKFCALGGVVMFGNREIVDSDVTAYTNGRDVKYGRKFIASLTDPELRFLVLHENYHKAYRHLSTWKHLFKKNPKLSNKACDYVINLALHDLDADEGFIKLPQGGCFDVKYRGMDSGQVFRLLEQEDEKDGEGGGDGESGGDGFDEHGWEDAEDMSDDEKKHIESAIDQALRQGAIMAGKRKGQMDRSLSNLLTPKVNWREVLREFVSSVCSGKDMSTWRKVNRRYVGSGVYMPSAYSETVGRVVVAVDTSGSIDNEALTEFLSEVAGICTAVQPEMVDLIYWGSSVVGHEKYGVSELDTLATSTKPKDGGGTSPSCISAYLKDEDITPECVVILTDGYVGNDWGGNWNGVPVLWCITTNGFSGTAETGKTIYM